MAMYAYSGWGQLAGPPPSFEQVLGTRDCDPAIGELVLRGDVARLFAPSGGDWPFNYQATLRLMDGQPVVVRVSKVAAGRETLLGDGWGQICDEFNLVPGDVAVFTKGRIDLTFVANFLDADGEEKLRRPDAGDDPPAPDFHFDEPDPHSSPQFVPIYGLPAQGTEGADAEASRLSELLEVVIGHVCRVTT